MKWCIKECRVIFENGFINIYGMGKVYGILLEEIMYVGILFWNLVN